MSDDEAAFLRTIRENPDADLPRLVYADYLEEQGHQLRAQFLRAHLELERLTEDSPRRRELAFWCRTQLDTQPHLLFEPPLQPKFARYGRGLIEAAEFWNTSDGEIASAFHLAPLRRVWVYGLDRWLSQLKRVPVENCLHTLDLTGNRLTADALRYLGTVMRFPQLKELVLTGCDLDDEAARVLCERMPFRELERIHVEHNPCSETGHTRLRGHFGRRLCKDAERDPARLYPIQEGYFTVGQAKELTQLLVWVTPSDSKVAWFDFAGNLLQTEIIDRRFSEDGDSARDRILSVEAFRPGTIWVKRFEFPDEGSGLDDFSVETPPTLFDPDLPRGAVFRRWTEWLEAGRYCWRLGHYCNFEWVLNRDGEVIST